MFLIVYARVIDNKKKGLEMEGPFYGQECSSMDEAHEECKKLVTSSKEHVLIKIFDLDDVDYHAARRSALSQFQRTFDQMQTAQELIDSPQRRR